MKSTTCRKSYRAILSRLTIFILSLSALFASTASAKTVNVLVLNYNPVLEGSGSTTLSQHYGWQDPQITSRNIIADIEKASGGGIKYVIAEWKNIDQGFPVKSDGTQFQTGEEFIAHWDEHGAGHKMGIIDHQLLLSEHNVVEKIDNGEIDEVWIWGPPEIGTWESCIAGPRAYAINGPGYPDIESKRPFVIMGFNYERGETEALHSLGHRAEGQISNAFGGRSNWNRDAPATPWDYFTTNACTNYNRGPLGVGTIHCPANAARDYDYANQATVVSNATDWLNNYPYLKGASEPINSSAWGDSHYGYMNYWFSHLPKAPMLNPDGYEQNWWKYIYSYQHYQIIEWTKQSKTKASYPINHTGSSLSRSENSNSDWYAYAQSKNHLSDNGAVYWQIGQEGKAMAVGLKLANTYLGFHYLEFALYYGTSGYVSIYEDGERIKSLGKYQKSDSYEIQRLDGKVSYRKNGNIVHVSNKQSQAPLHTAALIRDPGAKIQQVSGWGFTKTETQPLQWKEEDYLEINYPNGEKEDASDAGSELASSDAADFQDNITAQSKYSMPANGSIQWQLGQTNKAITVWLESEHSEDQEKRLTVAHGSGGFSCLYENDEIKSLLGFQNTTDTFEIERSNGIIRFTKNGEVSYTSSYKNDKPLYVRVDFNSAGAKLQNVKGRGFAPSEAAHIEIANRTSPVEWSNHDQTVASYPSDSNGSDLASSNTDDFQYTVTSAESKNTMPADGSIQWQLGQADKLVTVSLKAATGPSYDFTVEYDRGGYSYFYESESSRGFTGKHQPDDEFKIERRDGTIRFVLNGGVIFTWVRENDAPLYAIVKFEGSDVKIQNVQGRGFTGERP